MIIEQMTNHDRSGHGWILCLILLNQHEVFDVQPSATIKVPGWLGPLGGRANSLEIQDEQICRLSFS